MPIMLYPKCWRGRDDCDPIHCVDAEPHELTQEQFETLDYEPLSFVCAGKNKTREVDQDRYRLCFKNEHTDEMSDNDMQDLTSIIAVVGAALNYDACVKHSNGIVEVPAENTKGG